MRVQGEVEFGHSRSDAGVHPGMGCWMRYLWLCCRKGHRQFSSLRDETGGEYRRSRIRVRSSWVAASVKVTARMWPMRQPLFDHESGDEGGHGEGLPVPAEASIRRTPWRGKVR